MSKIQKALLALSVFVLLASGTLLLIPHTPVIAFYNTPEAIRQAVTSLAENPDFAGKTIFKFQKLDDTLPLSAQTKKLSKIDLLFTMDGRNASEIAESTMPPSEQVRNLMPSAMRKAGQNETRGYGLPLLLDHFEVAYNLKTLDQNGIAEPKTLSDLLSAAKKMKKTSFYPIVCAGGQDTDILFLSGALLEARFGLEGWQNVVHSLKNDSSFKTVLADKNFRAVLDELVRWRTDGLIHPEWFRMSAADVNSFMENDYTGIVFMSLSAHRTISQRTIEKFSSSFFPPSLSGSPRALTAPTLLGIRPFKKNPDKKAEAFLYRLARDDGQKKIGSITGLAPVNSTAETKDKQATDVRLWIASTGQPLPDLGSAGFSDAGTRAEFARLLRDYIQTGGVGY